MDMPKRIFYSIFFTFTVLLIQLYIFAKNLENNTLSFVIGINQIVFQKKRVPCRALSNLFKIRTILKLS